MKQTQLQWIIQQLDQYGCITRNAALSHFISRLASRINDLEALGWRFDTSTEGGDYVYRVVQRGRSPLDKKPVRQLALTV